MDRIQNFFRVLLFLGTFIGGVAMAEEASEAPKAEAGAETPAPAEKSAPPREKMTNIKGEVIEVDPAARRIKIKEGRREGGKEYTVDLTDGTVVTAGKTKKTFADIKPGDKVVARISEKDGKVTARSVRLAQEGKKPKKEAAPESEPPAHTEEKPAPAEPPPVSGEQAPEASGEAGQAPEPGR